MFCVVTPRARGPEKVQLSTFLSRSFSPSPSQGALDLGLLSRLFPKARAAFPGRAGADLAGGEAL